MILVISLTPGWEQGIKAIVHSKMVILSLFIHHQVNPYMYDFASSVEHNANILKDIYTVFVH